MRLCLGNLIFGGVLVRAGAFWRCMFPCSDIAGPFMRSIWGVPVLAAAQCLLRDLDAREPLEKGSLMFALNNFSEALVNRDIVPPIHDVFSMEGPAPFESPLTPFIQVTSSPSMLEQLPSFKNLLPWGVGAFLILLVAFLWAYFFWGHKNKQAPLPPNHLTVPLPPSSHNQATTQALLPMVPSLELPGRAGKLTHFELKPEGTMVGRAEDNDLVVSEVFPGWETVSHHHARLYKQGPYWVVEDLHSSNGVYVNQWRTDCNILQDGWTLGFGSLVCIFRDKSGESTYEVS